MKLKLQSSQEGWAGGAPRVQRRFFYSGITCPNMHRVRLEHKVIMNLATLCHLLRAKIGLFLCIPDRGTKMTESYKRRSAHDRQHKMEVAVKKAVGTFNTAVSNVDLRSWGYNLSNAFRHIILSAIVDGSEKNALQARCEGSTCRDI